MLYFRSTNPDIVTGWLEQLLPDQTLDPAEHPDALQTLRPSYDTDEDAFVVDGTLWLAVEAHGPFLDLLEPVTAEVYQEAVAAALAQLAS